MCNKILGNSKVSLPLTQKGTNRIIYFYAGEELKLNFKENLQSGHGYQVDSTLENTIENHSKATAKILILQGRPINEPVFQHGPFVTCNQEKMQEAIIEYQKTQFGGWPWDKIEMVHGLKPERFGKHANGRIDRPDST